MAKRARTDIVQLKLRIREALRAKLAAAAKHNSVSLNSEIAKRLEVSLVVNQLEEIVGRLNQTAEKFEARNTPLVARVAAQKQREQK
jgi:HicB family